MCAWRGGFVAAVVLLLCAGSASAHEEETAKPPGVPEAFLSVTVGVETEGLIVAVDRAGQATRELAGSIRKLAENPQLSDSQKAAVQETLDRVGGITGAIAEAVSGLPESIERTREPIVKAVNDVGNKLLWTLAGIGVLLLALVACTLWAVYFWTLRPVKQAVATASGNLATLAKSLEQTALLVERIQAKNDETGEGG
jgi:hypothetical protein